MPDSHYPVDMADFGDRPIEPEDPAALVLAGPASVEAAKAEPEATCPTCLRDQHRAGSLGICSDRECPCCMATGRPWRCECTCLPVFRDEVASSSPTA